MTDADKPMPDDDMPSAGRPLAGKPGSGNGPTVRLNRSALVPSAKPPTIPIAVPAPVPADRDQDSDEPAAVTPPGGWPVDDEPTLEHPKAGRPPVDDEATAEQPAPAPSADGEPVVERPASAGSADGEPMAERPATAGSADGEPVVERPATPGSAGGEPMAERPARDGSAGDEPIAEQAQIGDGSLVDRAEADRRPVADGDEPVATGPIGDGARSGPLISPDPVIRSDGDEPAQRRDAGSVRENDLFRAPDPDGPAVPSAAPAGGGANTVRASWRQLSSASALIWVLLALFGFTIVVQLRSNDTDQGLVTARQEDLVRILSDLEARDTRLSAEINALEQSQRQLTSGVAGRQAALAEADKRADELGLLAGTLPGRGPGLRIIIDPKAGTVKASAVLNAVQELRGAGGEVMQLVGANGKAVRIVASTYFVDVSGGGIIADGARLSAPYTLWVIGSPQTMQTALQIPGGVVASVESAGGSVAMDQRSLVEVTAVRSATDLQYARPVS